MHGQVMELTEDLKSALLLGFRVVQVDEMIVNTKTIQKFDWSKKYQNQRVSQSLSYMEPIAVIGAVSREKGIELMMTFRKSINVTKYKFFLEELRRCNPYTDMILMQDTLAVHKSAPAIERLEELGFRYSWTPAYSPEYNGGIEETWAMAKQRIKR